VAVPLVGPGCQPGVEHHPGRRYRKWYGGKQRDQRTVMPLLVPLLGAFLCKHASNKTAVSSGIGMLWWCRYWSPCLGGRVLQA
jgi:hypothetical protein